MSDIAVVTFIDSIEGEEIVVNDNELIIDGVVIARPLLEFRIDNTVYFRRTVTVGEIAQQQFVKERSATAIRTEDGTRLVVYNPQSLTIISSYGEDEEPEEGEEHDDDGEQVIHMGSEDDSDDEDGIVFDPDASDPEEGDEEGAEDIDFTKLDISVSDDDVDGPISSDDVVDEPDGDDGDLKFSDEL